MLTPARVQQVSADDDDNCFWALRHSHLRHFVARLWGLHIQIGYDYVATLFGEQVLGSLRVRRSDDCEAAARQDLAQSPENGGFIVNHEYIHGCPLALFLQNAP